MLTEINNSCQCQITAENIDQEQLTCFVNSSNYMTYLARLSGTSDIDSMSLVTLIESWVSRGPTILVQGVLMGLGEDCLSDVSAGVCSLFDGHTDNNNRGVIMGSVIAAAAVLITAAITVVTLLIWRSRGKKLSLQKEEE